MSSPKKVAKGGEYRHLIGGEMQPSGDYFDVVNPSTARAFAQAPHASEEQSEAAVAAANAAFPAWASLSLDERKRHMAAAADAMEAAKAELSELLVKEQGKPLGAASGEVDLCIECLRKMQEVELPVSTTTVDYVPASKAHTVTVVRRPIGVIAGITPWNYPMFCSVQKWAPALVLGNTFVLKPSPFTPLTALRYGELLQGVFPAGVFNVISGDDKAAFNVGRFLTSHPSVRKVSFTGSVPTGKHIMAACAADVKRVTLEMGGNDPAIVRADCDPAEVAPKLFGSAFGNTGQICCAIKRCYVHESIYDKFVEEMAKCAKAAKCGDGFEEGVEYGPLNNKMQYDRVSELVEDAKASGGTIVTGGAAIEGKDGFFYQPTIVTDVKEGVRLVDEEQFGPALPIMSYSDDDEAIKRANATVYGLGGSVWGKDLSAANALACRIRSGTVWVNDHASLTGAPFGGFGQSGLGRELGAADIDTFTECQTLKLATH